MSLIITIHTNEGIIMASDSRTTFNKQDFSPLPDGKGAIITNNQGVHYSDTTNKTFLTKNNIGISTCGAAAINGKPVAGYIEEFVNSKVSCDAQVSDVAKLILEEFRIYSPIPDMIFHIAGYESQDNILRQRFYRVFVAINQIFEVDVTSQGAAWNGETEILSRIINPYWTAVKQADGTVTYEKHNAPPIPWNFFSLQDAIDFSKYAMNTTIETMRFQERLKTVNDPIDILAIKPAGAFWVQKKELHA